VADAGQAGLASLGWSDRLMGIGKPRQVRRVLQAAVAALVLATGAAGLATHWLPLYAQGAAKPETYKNLQFTVTGIERSSRVSLKDCPPGTNTVNGTTRPGEEFAVVSVSFKVLPNFQPLTLKRPTVTDTSGKDYFTSAQFVDVGSVPEFSCTFPFRVPEGTKLKAFKVETASVDVSAADKK
jgi:hypothetical protein